MSGLIWNREMDLHKRELKQDIDNYIKAADVRQLNTFEGRLDRIKHQYDQENGILEKGAKAAGAAIGMLGPEAKLLSLSRRRFSRKWIGSRLSSIQRNRFTKKLDSLKAEP